MSTDLPLLIFDEVGIEEAIDSRILVRIATIEGESSKFKTTSLLKAARSHWYAGDTRINLKYRLCSCFTLSSLISALKYSDLS